MGLRDRDRCGHRGGHGHSRQHESHHHHQPVIEDDEDGHLIYSNGNLIQAGGINRMLVNAKR